MLHIYVCIFIYIYIYMYHILLMIQILSDLVHRKLLNYGSILYIYGHTIPYRIIL